MPRNATFAIARSPVECSETPRWRTLECAPNNGNSLASPIDSAGSDTPPNAVGEGPCCGAWMPGFIEIDLKHRQPRQLPIRADDLQALRNRVAEQRRDGEIGLQGRSHGLHVAHLAHGQPLATHLLERCRGDRPEHAGFRPERYRQRIAGVCIAAAGAGPDKPVAAQGLAILAATKLCREGQIDGAALEVLQQDDRVLADERDPY